MNLLIKINQKSKLIKVYNIYQKILITSLLVASNSIFNISFVTVKGTEAIKTHSHSHLKNSDQLENSLLEKNKIISSRQKITNKNPQIKLGNNITISPNFHLNVAFGDSTYTEPSHLASGAHDPNRNGISIQGLESNLSIHAWDWLCGFVSYNAFIDLDDKIDGEWEEIFAKIKKFVKIFNTNIRPLKNGSYF